MAKEGLTTTSKGVIAAASILLIGGATALVLWQLGVFKPRSNGGDGDNGSDGDTPTTCKHCSKYAAYPLKKGSKGKNVAAVQYGYNERFPNTPIRVDGSWGQETEDAINRLGASIQRKLNVIYNEPYQQLFKKYENI